MKKTLAMYLLICVTAVGLCGCASNKGQTAENGQPVKKVKHKHKKSKADRLKVGMTEAEVIQAIGKPKGKSMSSDGSEVWNYNDSEKAWIPYYSMSGGKFHTLVVVFDTNGKVKSWSSSSQSAY